MSGNKNIVYRKVSNKIYIDLYDSRPSKLNSTNTDCNLIIKPHLFLNAQKKYGCCSSRTVTSKNWPAFTIMRHRIKMSKDIPDLVEEHEYSCRTAASTYSMCPIKDMTRNDLAKLESETKKPNIKKSHVKNVKQLKHSSGNSFLISSVTTTLEMVNFYEGVKINVRSILHATPLFTDDSMYSNSSGYVRKKSTLLITEGPLTLAALSSIRQVRFQTKCTTEEHSLDINPSSISPTNESLLTSGNYKIINNIGSMKSQKKLKDDKVNKKMNIEIEHRNKPRRSCERQNANISFTIGSSLDDDVVEYKEPWVLSTQLIGSYPSSSITDQIIRPMLAERRYCYNNKDTFSSNNNIKHMLNQIWYRSPDKNTNHRATYSTTHGDMKSQYIRRLRSVKYRKRKRVKSN